MNPALWNHTTSIIALVSKQNSWHSVFYETSYLINIILINHHPQPPPFTLHNEANTAHALRRERALGHQKWPVRPILLLSHPHTHLFSLNNPPSQSLYLRPPLTNIPSIQIPRPLGQYRLATPKGHYELLPQRQPSTPVSGNRARRGVQQLAAVEDAGAVLGAAVAVLLCGDELGRAEVSCEMLFFLCVCCVLGCGFLGVGRWCLWGVNGEGGERAGESEDKSIGWGEVGCWDSV